MNEIVAFGRITQGTPTMEHRAWFLAQIPSAWEGHRVRYTMRLEGARQSDAYRGYYWSTVAPAFAAYLYEMGDGAATAESAHDVLCHKFLALGPCPVTGMPRRRSTSPDVMAADEFRRFVEDQVLPFLRVDCQLDVPDPDPEKRSPKRIAQLRRQDEVASRGAVQHDRV